METIKISDIIVKSPYLRCDTNIDSLVKSIETVGLAQPLVVNGNNELVAGARRLCALKELGYEEVPVHRIHKTVDEQELISIDENLIRLDLTKVEFEKCLSRGKELYEKLNPLAKKFEEEDLTIKEENDIQTELPNEKRSFIDITAQKTGLSKKVIKSAIDRDNRSSSKVKELRLNGELNATQTNEIIKLEKEDQEKLIPFVNGKSAKEIKDLVTYARTNGVERAIEHDQSTIKTAPEYKSFKTLAKRLNKVSSKILLEEMTYNDSDKDKFLKEITTLSTQLNQILSIHGESESIKEDITTDYIHHDTVEMDHDQFTQE